MSKLNWKPWHQVVQVRDDLKSGALTLSDLLRRTCTHHVVMGRAKPVYQTPGEFFALTYPTFNLRELAKDVVLRLAGKNDKAIRQLELTYGGGKTHTLIALYHLVNEPEKLQKLHLNAVDEFLNHITFLPPKSRVAALCFDKLDAEKGMEVCAPDGTMRWLRHPWSVLAYQLAGDEGLKILHPQDKADERDSAPAQPLLETLLRKPQEDDLSTLILMDEVLMYAREKIGLDPAKLAEPPHQLLPIPDASGSLKVDRKVGDRGVAAGHRSEQERPAWKGNHAGVIRGFPARTRAGRAAGAEGRRGGSSAAAVLQTGINQGHGKHFARM